MNIPLSAIELDASIQCRADIDIATVNEYAEAMQAGADFPPVVLFGFQDRAWIGDGWHRVMAARSAGLDNIVADLRAGSRVDALRFALGANAVHGRRRTNADKRCAVAIALREFGKMSDRAIADMCAVSHTFVENMRRALNPPIGNEYQYRTTSDGRQYPAQRKPAERPSFDGSASAEATSPPEPADPPLPKPGPPRNGMQFARMAVMDLEQIRPDDLERDQAIRFVRGWLDEHDT